MEHYITNDCVPGVRGGGVVKLEDAENPQMYWFRKYLNFTTAGDYNSEEYKETLQKAKEFEGNVLLIGMLDMFDERSKRIANGEDV